MSTVHTEREFTRLHLSSETNSTLFTNCCWLAVTRTETECPGCHTPILGRAHRTDEQKVQP